MEILGLESLAIFLIIISFTRGAHFWQVPTETVPHWEVVDEHAIPCSVRFGWIIVTWKRLDVNLKDHRQGPHCWIISNRVLTAQSRKENRGSPRVGPRKLDTICHAPLKLRRRHHSSDTKYFGESCLLPSWRVLPIAPNRRQQVWQGVKARIHNDQQTFLHNLPMQSGSPVWIGSLESYTQHPAFRKISNMALVARFISKDGQGWVWANRHFPEATEVNSSHSKTCSAPSDPVQKQVKITKIKPG